MGNKDSYQQMKAEQTIPTQNRYQQQNPSRNSTVLNPNIVSQITSPSNFPSQSRVPWSIEVPAARFPGQLLLSEPEHWP